MSSKENQERFELREGQIEVLNHIISHPEKKSISWGLPGGLGKTHVCAAAYKHKRDTGISERLFFVVASQAQEDQVRRSFARKCLDIGLKQIGKIMVLDRSSDLFRKFESGEIEIVISTIQKIWHSKKGFDYLRELLQLKEFMLFADEFHHFGDGMEWGDRLKAFKEMAVFDLALTATHERDNCRTIFDPLTGRYLYARGILCGDLKDFRLIKYEYEVDLFNTERQLVSYLCSDIVRNPETIPVDSLWQEKLRLRRDGEYVENLILRPLRRLIELRAVWGLPLQAIYRAMNCAAAEDMFNRMREPCDVSGLKLAVVHENRPMEDNRRILEEFTKLPEPGYDVLIVVGMGGEGLDAPLAIIAIDGFPANLEGAANQTRQFYLRLSRAIYRHGKKLPKQLVAEVYAPKDHPITLEEDLVSWLDSSRGFKDVPRDYKPVADLEEDKFDPLNAAEDIKNITEDRWVKFLNEEISESPEREAFGKIVEEDLKRRGVADVYADDTPQGKAQLDEFYERARRRAFEKADYGLQRDEANKSHDRKARGLAMRIKWIKEKQCGANRFDDHVYYRTLNFYLGKFLRFKDKKNPYSIEECQKLGAEIDRIDQLVRNGDPLIWLSLRLK